MQNNSVYTRQTYVQFPPQFGINTTTKYSYAEYKARYVGYGTAIILIIPHHKIEKFRQNISARTAVSREESYIWILGKRKERKNTHKRLARVRNAYNW